MAGERHETFVCELPLGDAERAQTALESGHDQAVSFAHYQELVKPKDAERYFNIRPAGGEAEGKV
jgi:hypothetical protein